MIAVEKSDSIGVVREDMDILILRGTAEWIRQKINGYCSMQAAYVPQRKGNYADGLAVLLANMIENWGCV